MTAAPRHPTRLGALARRFLILVAAVGVLSFALSFGAHIALEYDRAHADINQEFSEIERFALPALTMSAWTTNQAMAQAQIDGITGREHIAYAELSLDTGQTLRSGTPVAGQGIRREFPLEHGFEGRAVPVGRLAVVASLDSVAARLRTMTLVMLATQGLQTALTVGLIILLFHFSIYRRLRSISAYTEALTPETLDQPLVLRPAAKGPGDELDLLAHSVNRMRENLSRSIAELNQANARLQDEVRERALTQEALADKRRMLDNIIEGTSDAVYVKDLKGRYLRANSGAARAVGLSVDEILGRDDFTLFPSQEAKALMARDREIMHGGAVRTYEEHVSGAEGPRTFLSTKGPLHGVHGEVLGLFGIARDITARKAAEAELLQAKELAEAANTSKSEFLANMSHEIRTPLNGVLGMLQLLQQEASPEERAEYTSLAFEAGRRLLSLLNDVLDFSKMEAGQLRFIHGPFQLGRLFEEVCGVFSLSCKSKGLELSFGIDESVPETLLGDEARIRQVLFNLVGNAIKFTASGSVQVQAWAYPSRRFPGRTRLHLAVSDTGVGIPDGMQARVFERFTQSDASYTRRYEGAGLGLAIVRRIVDLMDGGVVVDSKVDQGTTINLNLLLDAPQQAGAGAGHRPGGRAHASPSPLRILLAEDEPIGQLSMRAMLKHLGHEVVAAGNGAEALEAWQQGDFDCILMDVQMPELNGVEVTQIIRAATEHGRKAAIHIIALTAYAMQGDREIFLAAGMDDHVAKPVEMDRLKEALARVGGTGQA